MNPSPRDSLLSLRWGARWMLLTFALGFPIALAAGRAGFPQLHRALPLIPDLVWKGELWRLLTYAFLAGGFVDWCISLFWLTTLVLVLGKNWSGRVLWTYCLLTALGGALPIVLLSHRPFTGNSAIIFGLLVAWERIYGRERILVLGFGETSVRRAAILVAIINAIILYFCCGWFVTTAMLCGGGTVGWLYFAASSKLTLRHRGQIVESGRVSRLEL